MRAPSTSRQSARSASPTISPEVQTARSEGTVMPSARQMTQQQRQVGGVDEQIVGARPLQERGLAGDRLLVVDHRHRPGPPQQVGRRSPVRQRQAGFGAHRLDLRRREMAGHVAHPRDRAGGVLAVPQFLPDMDGVPQQVVERGLAHPHGNAGGYLPVVVSLILPWPTGTSAACAAAYPPAARRGASAPAIAPTPPRSVRRQGRSRRRAAVAR